MIPPDLLTPAYARGGFAYAEGRYDTTLTKHVHRGFGRCSSDNGRKLLKLKMFVMGVCYFVFVFCFLF